MTETRPTFHEALNRASLFLEEKNREPRVAELLLLHHAAMSKADFLSSLRKPVPEEVYRAFDQSVRNHAKSGVPVQHLIGTENFYGREFIVNQDVLIPRPETEELVMGVLEHIDKLEVERPGVIDVGTGSGIIAVTLKLEHPGVDMTATDISDNALIVAKQNAAQLGADIHFSQGDFLQPAIDAQRSFDVIVSNPPYIPYEEADELDDTVKNFDPEMALFAEDNGLAAYKKILSQAVQVLKSGGLIAFEIGHQQGPQVAELIRRRFPESSVEVRKDINRKDRMVFAKLP
ncbi:peptide chain release factor N(5)-glutamine methyltransferase [Sediminibacillus massiliensis]|uniref:peptide chain release factor N(5)-glutamine methyltransferase n=1 Tax=Sediminibacillus massiliensis TaxID=1926277 RepID=UPI00098831B5|nr:peptide chain release factor N(5)-glutamine methyltransferase [Sediminibacillus massiliensis]